MSTGCENCGEEIAYGYLRAGQAEVIKDLERLICSMMNTYADEKGVRAPCGDLKGNRYGNTAKHIARALILEFDQTVGKTGEVTGETAGEINRAKMAGIPEGYTEDDVEQLIQFRQQEQSYHPDSQCTAYIRYVNALIRGRKTGEVREMEGDMEKSSGYKEAEGTVGKVGRQDFTVDWHYSGKGGGTKTMNCTDPVAAAERSILELRKFAEGCTGEVAGEVENADEYVCSDCGSPVRNGDIYCSNCQKELDWRQIQADHQDGNKVGEIGHASTPFDEPFSCADCGKPVYTGDLHCSSCGKPLNWEEIDNVGSGLDD